MAAFKDKKNGSWYVQFRYTDWRGERQQKLKRGFATKKEAQAWEREFLMQKQADINMSFESFVALYEKDVKPKLKLNTWLSKEHIIRTKILPYFKKRKLSEITARDVIDWQNEIRQHTKSSGESYSSDYLKNVHTQLSCIFNHAIKYYGLQINPAAKAGNMGSEQPKEMLFWTKEEYLKFIDAMMDKPMLYYAFEILYWCGIREGELLALTPADFDFEKKTLRINKSYQRLQGKDVITTPKTKKSNRVIQMPDFLCDEMQDYFKQLYGLESDSRIFPLTKHTLKRGMEFGCKASGVKVIRIHDLRHSHVSLLINMGYSAVAIGNRVGHESVEITYRYAHLFPTMKPLKDVNAGNDVVKNTPESVSNDVKAEPEKIDFSKVEIEPLFKDFVDFETFSKSDFRAVKVLACEAVPKSKKLLKFTLDDGSGENRTILSGIHAYYEPEELVGKTCIAITNLPPRPMMGIDSCGMLISAVHHEEGEEKLHLLMVDDHIPAGAKLY